MKNVNKLRVDITNEQLQILNDIVHFATIGDEANIYTNFINFSKNYIKVFIIGSDYYVYERELKSNLWYLEILKQEKFTKKELNNINSYVCQSMCDLICSFKSHIDDIGDNLYNELKKSLKLNINFYGKSVNKTTLHQRKKISIDNFVVNDMDIFNKFQEKSKSRFYLYSRLHDYTKILCYFDYTSNNFKVSTESNDVYEQYHNTRYQYSNFDELLYVICMPLCEISKLSWWSGWYYNKINEDDKENIKSDIDYYNYFFNINFDAEYIELIDVFYSDFKEKRIRHELLNNKDDSKNLLFIIKKILTRLFKFNEYECMFKTEENNNEIFEIYETNEEIKNKISLVLNKIDDVKMRLAIVKLFYVNNCDNVNINDNN